MSHFLKKTILISVAAVLCAYVAIGLVSACLSIPSFRNVTQDYQSSYIHIVDRHGNEIEHIRANFKQRRLPWVALPDYSAELIDAIIHSEDKRFYRHWGVDWLALADAVWGKIIGRKTRGASTITMQLVGLLKPELHNKHGRRSYWQKIQQLLYAQGIEMAWSKTQILEAYLNLVPLRGELVGIPSAAKYFFQKYSDALNKRESVLLAAMLRSPNASTTVLSKRACRLLSENACPYLERFVANSLHNPHSHMMADPKGNLHYAQAFLKEYQQANPSAIPSVVHATLDARLQSFVQASVRARLLEIFQEKVSDAAVVVLDNKTGEILAYVGSSAELSQAQYVDHARALRQAGSTLKPFLYGLAFDLKRLTAASLLNDSPLSLSLTTGLYTPQNYDHAFKGWVSVRTALASSLNIPAVQALTMVGVEPFRNILVNLGLPLTETGDYYGYSLALGSADVSLLSLTNAYRSLANLGEYSDVQWLPINTPVQQQKHFFISPESAWIIGDILSDRHARVVTFGLDSALSTPFKTAVKTGTSKDMRDNWAVGWSSHYTVGVWVGNSAGGSMRDVSGVSGAAPIWHDIMHYLHKDFPSEFLPPPEKIIGEHITYTPRVEPERQEFFIAGSQMQHIQLTSNLVDSTETAVRITHPTDGTIMAIDPDIPNAYQLLRLEAQQLSGKPVDHVLWQLNGKVISRDNPFAWGLRPGNYRLQLFVDGNKTDEVGFQVRGSGVE